MNYYKACRKSIVTLEPLEDTVNNETRTDVTDSLHAKFRCNRVKVISIINVITGEEMNQDISIYNKNFIYNVDEVVSCNNFDTDKDTICGEGIHYFKTKEAALSWFYRQTNNERPDGTWVEWHENGNKEHEKSYKDGKPCGKWVGWYDNGNKEYEKSYKGGNKDGKYVGWYENGNKYYERSHKDGKLDGKWVGWYENGKKNYEESYKDGRRMSIRWGQN